MSGNVISLFNFSRWRSASFGSWRFVMERLGWALHNRLVPAHHRRGRSRVPHDCSKDDTWNLLSSSSSSSSIFIFNAFMFGWNITTYMMHHICSHKVSRIEIHLETNVTTRGTRDWHSYPRTHILSSSPPHGRREMMKTLFSVQESLEERFQDSTLLFVVCAFLYWVYSRSGANSEDKDWLFIQVIYMRYILQGII